jgi:hypothetical protein
MEIDMRTYTYCFEDIELSLADGINLATGSIKVQYHINRAEPDVGIPRHVEVDGYCDLDVMLTLVDEDGEALTITHVTDNDRQLIKKIVFECGEDDIVEKIENSI